MCSNQNRRFKSKRVQHDYRNIWIEFYLYCKFKCNFDKRKCNSDQWWNNSKCWCERKKRHVCEKDYIWNPAMWNCKNGKYLENIIDDSAITCANFTDSYEKKDSCNEETETIPINGYKSICEMQNFYISIFYLHFY